MSEFIKRNVAPLAFAGALMAGTAACSESSQSAAAPEHAETTESTLAPDQNTDLFDSPSPTGRSVNFDELLDYIAERKDDINEHNVGLVVAASVFACNDAGLIVEPLHGDQYSVEVISSFLSEESKSEFLVTIADQIADFEQATESKDYRNWLRPFNEFRTDIAAQFGRFCLIDDQTPVDGEVA